MAKKGKIHGFEVVDEIGRPERIKKYKYIILIVCEDENTEKVYFNSFRSRIPSETIFLKAIGTGRDPKGVVERAIIERDELTNLRKSEIDEVWVVFDKDDADQSKGKIKRFHEALDISDKQNFNLAFSNEVFELWLLLHLTDIDPKISLPRTIIYSQLEEIIKANGHVDFVYKHGNSDVLKKIAAIGDEQLAFTRAEILIDFHKDNPLIECNPITYVNRLVLNLYDWINYYSY